ncbi:hypothetical protein LguiA_002827 [Lonicera macranthoides]
MPETYQGVKKSTLLAHKSLAIGKRINQVQHIMDFTRMIHTLQIHLHKISKSLEHRCMLKDPKCVNKVSNVVVVDCCVCSDPNLVLRFAFVEFTDEAYLGVMLSQLHHLLHCIID